MQGQASHPASLRQTLLSAQELPNDYDTDAVAEVSFMNYDDDDDTVSRFDKVTLYISYTTGAGEAGTKLVMKVETGVNSSDTGYRSTAKSASSGAIDVYSSEYTFQNMGGAGATNYKASFSIENFDPYMQFSFKESGTPTNHGTITVKLLASGKTL